MKVKFAIWSVIIIVSSSISVPAQANQIPKVESFTFTPNEVDLIDSETKIQIELIVSHPNGIENVSTLVTFRNSSGDTLNTYLTRTDNPIIPSLSKVTFKGNLQVPRSIAPGVFNLKADPIKNNSSAGYQYTTGVIEPTKVRELPGGEFGLLIRNNGELNLSYETFVGPTYQTHLPISFNDTLTYNSSVLPIWKVGEVFYPGKFYELRVKDLSLKVESKTPMVCSTDGKQMNLIKEGTCSFTVFTSKDKNYAERVSNQTVTITGARSKPQLSMQPIQNQTAKDLPKRIEIFRVYTSAEGWVFPRSSTPNICSANGFFVNIVSGGICEITFQTSETREYLASDIYKVSFEVIRDPQTITFTLPSTANVSTRSLALAATASGGGAITYSTTSAGICSITGSTLNLIKNGNCEVTATQAGTSTLAPASATATVVLSGAAVSNRKTITCVKGKSTKRVSGVNPKCPRGFKIKR
ncbi:MAG: hypothetical protein ACO3H5_07355 [Candidatus Nanopelagicales bacterium]